MVPQTRMFAEEAMYCVDTNVILNFWKLTPSEPYGKDVFSTPWRYFESRINSGAIVATKVVETELKSEKWSQIKGLKKWINTHDLMFLDINSQQISAMRPILNRYPVYANNINFSADLEVMGLASSKNLAVITSESSKVTHKPTRPKIPYVCDEFGIKWVSVVGFFRQQGKTF